MDSTNNQIPDPLAASVNPAISSTEATGLNLSSAQLPIILSIIIQEPEYIYAHRRTFTLMLLNITGFALAIASIYNEGRGLIYASLSLVVFNAISRHNLKKPINMKVRKLSMEKVAFKESKAAEYLAVSRGYWRHDRMFGFRKNHESGPNYIKIGRTIRYLKVDLDAWLVKYRIERQIK